MLPIHSEPVLGGLMSPMQHSVCLHVFPTLLCSQALPGFPLDLTVSNMSILLWLFLVSCSTTNTPVGACLRPVWEVE